ncbi:MAG: hypothetical protein KC445_10570 [Anaerolineales bacterium]|nr:hypothetical protein [Anaerolineales bacterium]
MNKATAVFTQTPHTQKTASLPTGRLLINDADEIVYANTQARHFLGLLSEETLPKGQKFLPLLRETYQIYPTLAWLGWPKRPSPTTTRYLIYTLPNSTAVSLFKVEIIEQIWLEGQHIWVVAIQLIENRVGTAVYQPTA